MAEPGPAPGASGPSAAGQGPSLLGKYRLIAELGRGGMADVYLAVAPGPGGFNKLLVIKLLRDNDDPFLVTMFLDEAKIAARASHPNIVTTFDVVQEPGRAYLVMEYLDGPSLSRLRRAATKKNERLPLPIELHIAREALKGLHAVHELRGFDGQLLNVVHRDFTPQNLMTTMGGDAKIVDFGIAKAHDQEGKTSAGMFKGKLSYVPPEQLLGAPVDRRTDIFAAGVMLYEAVTGASPWVGKTNAQITHLLATNQIPRLMENPDAPAELAAIVDQAMACDPDARYSTAEELRVALDEFVRDHKIEVDRGAMGRHITSLLGDAGEATRKLIEQQLQVKPGAPEPIAVIDAMTPSPAEKVLGRALPQLMQSDELPDTGRKVSSELPASGTPVSVITVVSPMTRAVIGLIAVVVVGLVVAVSVLLSRSGTQTVTTPPPVVDKPAPAPVVVEKPAERQVKLKLSASPAEARLFLDSLELTNPYEGSFPAETKLHELKAISPGYEEQRRGLQFDRDLSLELSLVPVPAPTPVVAPTPHRPRKTRPQPSDPDYFAPPPPEKQQPKRTLDNVEFE